MGKSSRRSRRRGGSYDRERCRKKPPPTTRTLSSQPKYDCFFDDCDKTFVCWGDCNKHLKGFHHVTDMRGVQQLCSRKLDMKYSLPFPSKRDDVVNASSDIHFIHCLPSMHVYSDDEAVNFFERWILPSLERHTNRERLHDKLQFKVKYYHPVVRRVRRAGHQMLDTCYCGCWACHPQTYLCQHHIQISKLKEFYPYPHLRGTPEDQEWTKFHFWLSTKGGRHCPVHLEYNRDNREDFSTPKDPENDLMENTQHLINILRRKNIVEGGRNFLTFKAKKAR